MKTRIADGDEKSLAWISWSSKIPPVLTRYLYRHNILSETLHMTQPYTMFVQPTLRHFSRRAGTRSPNLVVVTYCECTAHCALAGFGGSSHPPRHHRKCRPSTRPATSLRVSRNTSPARSPAHHQPTRKPYTAASPPPSPQPTALSPAQ